MTLGEINSAKQVTISRGNSTKSLLDDKIKLYVEDFNISFSNEFSEPIQDIMNTFKNSVIGKIINGTQSLREAAQGSGLVKSDLSVSKPSSKSISKYSKIKAWKGTSNIKFSLKFEFNYGKYGLYNAKEEVWTPIITLAKLGLPETISGKLNGPMPTPAWFWGEIFSSILSANEGSENVLSGANTALDSAATAQKAFDDRVKDMFSFDLKKATKSNSSLSELALDLSKANDKIKNAAYSAEGSFLSNALVWEKKILKKIDMEIDDSVGNGVSALVTVKIGNVFNNKCIVIDSSHTFDMDNLDDNGFPLQGHITINFESVGMVVSGDLISARQVD